MIFFLFFLRIILVFITSITKLCKGVFGTFCTTSCSSEQRFHMLSLVLRGGAGSASSHVTHLKFQPRKIEVFFYPWTGEDPEHLVSRKPGMSSGGRGCFCQGRRRAGKQNALSFPHGDGKMGASRSRGFVRPCCSNLRPLTLSARCDSDLPI